MATSTPLLIATFLGALVLWGLYSSTGRVRLASPGVIGQVESLPPLQSILDSTFLFDASRVFPATVTLPLALALLLVHAALMAFCVSMVLEGAERGVFGGPAVLPALGRAARAVRTVFTVDAAFLLMVFVLPTALAAILGIFGLILAVVAVMYFLAYAPVVAVRDGPGVLLVFRLAYRGSRLRGPQHTLLVFPYLMATLYLALRPYGGPAQQATPSLLTWGLALFLNFVHVSILAALTHRWLAIRDDLVTVEPPPERRRLRLLSGLR